MEPTNFELSEFTPSGKPSRSAVYTGSLQNLPIILQSIPANQAYFQTAQLSNHVNHIFKARNDFCVLASLCAYSVFPMQVYIGWQSPMKNVQNLAQYLANLTVTERVIALYGLIIGLNKLHTQNIIHGNLNPWTIFFDKQHHPIMTCYGMSQLIAQNPIPSGTYTSIAPEVLQGAAPSSASDVYALGMIAYALGSGVLPFFNPPTLPILPEEMSFFKTIFEACTQTDPKNRPTVATLYAQFTSSGVKFPPGLDASLVTAYINKTQTPSPPVVYRPPRPAQNPNAAPNSPLGNAGRGQNGGNGRGYRGNGNYRGNYRGDGNYRGRGDGNYRGRGDGNYRGRGGHSNIRMPNIRHLQSTLRSRDPLSDKQAAFGELKRLAKAGLPSALEVLANSYRYGVPGVTDKREDRATKLYRQAYDKGSWQAGHNLAVLLAWPKDPQLQNRGEAKLILEQLIANPAKMPAGAFYNLGRLYLEESNLQKAQKYFELACTSRNPAPSWAHLCRMYMAGKVMNQDWTKAQFCANQMAAASRVNSYKAQALIDAVTKKIILASSASESEELTDSEFGDDDNNEEEDDDE